MHHVMEVLATDQELVVLESDAEQVKMRRLINKDRGDAWAENMPAYEVALMAFAVFTAKRDALGLSAAVIRLFRKVRLALADIKRLLAKRTSSRSVIQAMPGPCAASDRRSTMPLPAP